MKIILLLVINALLFSACGTSPIDIHTPLTRFDSPESNGKKFGVSAAAGIVSNEKTTITPDYGLYSAADTPVSFDSATTVGANANLGITERLDIGLRGHINVPLLFEIKYQLIGDSRIAAKEGNFS